jgi:DNA-binding response OmpR family regulator
VTGKTILVIDDEALISGLLEDALVDGGYCVQLAYTGDDAIAVLDAQHSEFAGLITDIRMPGSASGWDVARHARELCSDFPVVYMSGDSAAEWSANGVPNSIMVDKPFATAQIVTAISNLLNGS